MLYMSRCGSRERHRHLSLNTTHLRVGKGYRSGLVSRQPMKLKSVDGLMQRCVGLRVYLPFGKGEKLSLADSHDQVDSSAPFPWSRRKTFSFNILDAVSGGQQCHAIPGIF